MKKIIYLLVAGVVLLGAVAFTTIKKYTDIFKQLKIDDNEAKEYIFVNFEEGSLGFPHSSVITKLAVGQREAAVKEIGDYIKTYTQSKEFAERYKAAREAAKPQGTVPAETKIKTRIEELEGEIVTMEEDMKKSTGDMRKLYEMSLAELKKQLKALKDPSDPMHKEYTRQATKEEEWETNMAAEDLKYWQQEYPESAKELVKRRLQKFMDFTSDIDFSAKLVKRGNKMVFADPALEEKDALWKACFRCGKETITAARQYAKQWLSTL
jgi:hypothetical protein